MPYLLQFIHTDNRHHRPLVSYNGGYAYVSRNIRFLPVPFVVAETNIAHAIILFNSESLYASDANASGTITLFYRNIVHILFWLRRILL